MPKNKKSSAKTKEKILIFFLLLFFVFSLAPTASAALNLNLDYPAIPIPGGSIDLNALDPSTMSLGDLVVFIYAAAIWIGGLIAFISLGYAGFTWIFSGESPAARNKAKTWFTNVLWGLGILFLSYIFLVLINPDLINLDFNQQAAEEGDGVNYELPPDMVGISDDNGDFACLWDTASGSCGAHPTLNACDPSFEPDNSVCAGAGTDTECALAGGLCVPEGTGGIIIKPPVGPRFCNVDVAGFACQDTWEFSSCTKPLGGAGSCQVLSVGIFGIVCSCESAGAGGLLSPPNLGTINSQGYYQMPLPLDDSYQFSTNTPSFQRCGSKELIDVIYTATKRFNEKWGGPKIKVGDLNATGHLSHSTGVNVDISSWGQTVANMDNAFYSRTKTTDLAKMFIDTGLVKSILYNDPAVELIIDAYAISKGLPGHMSWYTGHRDHFHVSILDKYKGVFSRTCAP